ncbi:MAG: hypothetical protein AVDCRST_MAG20-153, partial [uncultured Acidimicrobiales bacterium]
DPHPAARARPAVRHVRRAVLRPRLRLRRHPGHGAHRRRPHGGRGGPLAGAVLARVVVVDAVHLDPQPGGHRAHARAGVHPPRHRRRLRHGHGGVGCLRVRPALVRRPLPRGPPARAGPPGARRPRAGGHRRPPRRVAVGGHVDGRPPRRAGGRVRRRPGQDVAVGPRHRRRPGRRVVRRAGVPLGPPPRPLRRAPRAVRHHRPGGVADRGRHRRGLRRAHPGADRRGGSSPRRRVPPVVDVLRVAEGGVAGGPAGHHATGRGSRGQGRLQPRPLRPRLRDRRLRRGGRGDRRPPRRGAARRGGPRPRVRGGPLRRLLGVRPLAGPGDRARHAARRAGRHAPGDGGGARRPPGLDARRPRHRPPGHDRVGGAAPPDGRGGRGGRARRRGTGSGCRCGRAGRRRDRRCARSRPARPGDRRPL